MRVIGGFSMGASASRFSGGRYIGAGIGRVCVILVEADWDLRFVVENRRPVVAIVKASTIPV